MQQPKILFLAHRAPYPPDRGDRIRSFHILKFLAERADVWLACLTDEPFPQTHEREVRNYCRDLRVVQERSPGRAIRGMLSVSRGKTLTEGWFHSRRLRNTIDRWSRTQRFDVVFAYCSSVVGYTATPELRDVPLVVDLVDVDSQKWRDYEAVSRGWKRRLFRLEAERLQKLERQFGLRAKAVVVTTDAEADVYRSFAPEVPVTVVRNGVDLEYFCPGRLACERASFSNGRNGNSARPAGQWGLPAASSSRLGAPEPLVQAMAKPEAAMLPSEQPTCLFVGVLDYKANIDGITWFCRHVWPQVRRRRPDARFQLVGRRPAGVIRRLAGRNGIDLADDVPDVRPYLESASVVVAPLRIARGVQNKVLEALAMQKAVVASPQALVGLDAQPGLHLLRAESPQDWVNAILRLFADSTQRHRLGTSGRRYVERHHCWSSCLEPLAEVFELEQRDFPNRINFAPEMHIATADSSPARP